MMKKDGRRCNYDRRQFSYSYHLPERRSGVDRRSGGDRRDAERRGPTAGNALKARV